MLGTLRGVGAGGSSKSRRLRILPEPRGVAKAVAWPLFVGDRWLCRYERRCGSFFVGERLDGVRDDCLDMETDSNCWVKSSRRLVVSLLSWYCGIVSGPRRGVGEGDRS
jgi:hypothetical protein